MPGMKSPGSAEGDGADPPHFDYLVKKQYKYGYSVFLNINICHNNMDDVRQLTELAHDKASLPTITSASRR